jgi:hypothetical protein
VCLGIDGKDWVLDDSGDPRLLTTYGRDPAVEVRVPVELGPESGPAALVELAPVVDALPANGRTCS